MTCDKKSKKNKIPCQAFHNKLEISGVSQEFTSLNKLETALISQRYHGERAICNIAVDVRDICNSLSLLE